MIHRAAKRIPCEKQPHYLRFVTISYPGMKSETYMREAYRHYYVHNDSFYDEVGWYRKVDDNWELLPYREASLNEAVFQNGFK